MAIAATHNKRPKEFPTYLKEYLMNTMNLTPEQIRAATKANLDAIIEITTAQFSAVEKIANLQAVANQERVRRHDRQRARPRRRRQCAGVRQAAGLVCPTRLREGDRLLERRVRSRDADQRGTRQGRRAPHREWNDGAVSFLDQALKNIPGASDAVVGAMKQAIAVGNSAYENLTKATKQATDMAEANVAAATESVKGFVAKTRKAA
jgi:hypothetical protein